MGEGGVEVKHIEEKDVVVQLGLSAGPLVPPLQTVLTLAGCGRLM